MKSTSLVHVAIATMLLALGACGGGSGEEEAPPPPTGLQPTLASIQANIFTLSCAKSNCHTGAMPQAGLNLTSSSSSWNNLVGMVSSQDASLTRVIPTNPDGSFLIHKLEGMGPGGGSIVGMRMPDDGPPYLPQSAVDVIRLWIFNGANP